MSLSNTNKKKTESFSMLERQFWFWKRNFSIIRVVGWWDECVLLISSRVPSHSSRPFNMFPQHIYRRIAFHMLAHIYENIDGHGKVWEFENVFKNYSHLLVQIFIFFLVISRFTCHYLHLLFWRTLMQFHLKDFQS